MYNIENNGFEVLEDFLSVDEISSLIQAVEGQKLGAARGGIRNAERTLTPIGSGAAGWARY